MKYAPFIVTTLNRSTHFIRMMESLKRNEWAKYTDVYVGLDYPPSPKYEDGWRGICDYLENGDFSVFSKFVVFRRDHNLGAGANNRMLFEYVRERYDRWIYCDDDCEFSPNFLEYMDKCLEQFKDDPDVVAINGYSYPIKWVCKDGSTCFKQDFNVATWGIGLWNSKSDVMKAYITSNRMLKDAPKVIKKGCYNKMIDSTFLEYFESSLRYFGRPFFMNSFTDCAMTAYLACADKYAVTPVVSKVRNWGFDGSGLYCIATDGDGSDARHMNYSNQHIDESMSFDLVLNDGCLLEANRDLMNRFDCVTVKELHTAKCNFWMIKYFGYWISRFFHHIIALIRFIIIKLIVTHN